MTKGMALIEFETLAIEDRAKSNEEGHWVGRDIDIAKITPVGGRHTHEQEVTPDLLKQWKNTPENKYRYDAYMAWKDGAEPPVNGSSLKDWPPISPAQLKQLNGRNIRSVEELAEIPDDFLASFGPGFRALRDKAREWLRSSGDIGKVVAEVSILKEKLETVLAENARKDTLIAQLLQRIDEGESLSEATAAALGPKRGRPTKAA